MASSVENRMARALPVLRMLRLASVTPTRADSSLRVMCRSASTRSRLTRTGSDREFLIQPQLPLLLSQIMPPLKHDGKKNERERRPERPELPKSI